MSPVVKRLRPEVDGPAITMDPAVVRIQARFGNVWAAWGSGFFMSQWPSSIITARHVVALPQGIAPNDVRVEAFVEGTWSRLDVSTVAFPSGGLGARDVAIVRIQGTCAATLQAATVDGPCRVEVWGYPVLAGRPPGAPLVVGCRAQPVAGQIRLDRPGRPGMSGGPVVAVSDTGVPLAVVGIYLGAAPSGPRANAIVDDALFATKDAAMNAVAMQRGTPS